MARSAATRRQMRLRLKAAMSATAETAQARHQPVVGGPANAGRCKWSSLWGNQLVRRENGQDGLHWTCGLRRDVPGTWAGLGLDDRFTHPASIHYDNAILDCAGALLTSPAKFLRRRSCKCKRWGLLFCRGPPWSPPHRPWSPAHGVHPTAHGMVPPPMPKVV